MCKVAVNYSSTISSKDTRSEEERSFELPDGTIIEISLKAAYKPAEILFDPKIR
jgi:hypothetical protein